MDYSVNQNDIDTQAVLMYYMYGVLEQLDIPDAHDHLKKHETQIEEKIHRWMKKEIPKDLEKEYKNKVKAIKNRGYLEDKEKAYIESAKKKMIDRKTTELNYAKMTWLQYKNKKLIWIGKKVYPELTPFWGVIKEKDATGEAMDW